MPLNRNKGLRYKIIDELLKKRRGYTIEEIRAKVNEALADWDNKEVTPRTIYNDLDELQSVYDLDITKAGHRYKYTDPNDSFRKSRANREEKQTVELSLEAFAGTMRHFPFFNKFSDVINRMLAGDLYAGMDDEDKVRIIQIGESYNESGQQHIEKIYEAIKNKTAIAVLYNKGPNSMNWRIISPYILKEYRNQWYMVGYSKDSSRGPSSSVYALSKIESLRMLDKEQYIIDPKFNADDYFRYCLGVYHDLENPPVVVRLKFNGELLVQHLKTHKLHSTMQIISCTDMEIVVSMEVYDKIELDSLILGYGASVEVLEPAHIRNRVIQTLKSNLAIYQDTKS